MRRSLRNGLAAAAAAACVAALPGAAVSGVTRAEDILPPGQSGFVSTPGLADGTGSPHLYDQSSMFVNFQYTNALFNPTAESEEAVPKAGVKITRDRWGVPNITADSEQNAWWGAGYAVAQDRLFQLELFRRATQGRLAEIVGKDYLEDDIVARRDYYTLAELRDYSSRLPPALVERFGNYRDGVNAWIEQVRNDPSKLPGEFGAVGLGPPRNWDVVDSASVGVFLARTVPSGDGPELPNARTLRRIGARGFEALLPLRIRGQLPTIPRSEGLYPSQPGRTAKQERSAFRQSIRFVSGLPLPSEGGSAQSRSGGGLLGRLGLPGGSSMAAVRIGGARSRGALLFNGPQLGYSVPELFVELELHAPGYDVRGVTAAGVPVIGIGHNGNVAWGFTSGLTDEDDLYAERLVPGQSERYRFRGEERTMQCRSETFTYRPPPSSATSILDLEPPPTDSGTQVERICRTVHGPVQARAGDVAYARRYAIWEREFETLVGLDMLNRARDIRDVDRAMQEVSWNENVMAADSQGNIGYWHPGLLPLRPRGWDERLPYPGTGEAEWRGLLDRRTQTPRVINPKQGWLANWNNVPSDGWTSGDGESNERLSGRYHRVGWLMRLVRRLVKKPSYDGLKGTIQLAGTVSQQRPLATTPLRRAARGATGRAAAIFNALLAWNGSYHRVDGNGTVDPGVAIWEQFKDEAEKLAVARFGGNEAVEDLAGGTGSSHQFDISNGEAYALRTLSAAQLRQAAEATFAALAERFATEDVARWRDPRKMYEVSAQGAGDAPDLPFFDRGTWEQFVELRP